MTERNGTIAKMADINSHLAKTKNSITSGIKNVIASFYAYKKRPFCGLFYVYLALMVRANNQWGMKKKH